MLHILDLNATPHAAFWHGLAKGIAAPLMLYGRHSPPQLTIPQVQAVRPTRLRSRANSDWEAIGTDLQVALSRHEREE